MKRLFLIAILFLLAPFSSEAYPYLNYEKSTFKRSYIFASLSNEYKTQENETRRILSSCRILRGEMDFADVWTYGSGWGISVRDNDFSVYRFWGEFDDENQFIGSGCRKVGDYNYGSIYSSGSKKVEFSLKLLNEKERNQCYEYGKKCYPIEIFAFIKKDNSEVKKSWVFRVSERGELSYRTWTGLF
tara:strand:- start:110 stop:670 length:561 start_codon:yes stop_codon:yes gene_type:complete